MVTPRPTPAAAPRPNTRPTPEWFRPARADQVRHWHAGQTRPVAPVPTTNDTLTLVDGGGADTIAALLGALAARQGFCISARAPDSAPPPCPPGFFDCETGGSLGPPKRIRRSAASWIASFDVTASRFAITPDQGYAVLGRLCHSLSLYALLEALHIGAPVQLLAQARPDQQAQALRESGAQVLYATPTQLRLLLGGLRRAGLATLPALRRVFCGGGALDDATRAALAQALPRARVHVFYGAAETSFIALDDGSAPAGTVGRAYPGVEIAIRDQAGRPAGTAPGDIWVKSPYLFDRYITPGRPRRDADGFLCSEELGQLDPGGHLRVLGRTRRMVSIADQVIFPEHVETALLADHDVVHAAVLPRPDARRGAVLIAAAALRPGADPDAVLARARTRCGPLAAPRALIALDPFPLLVSGKPDLRAIARELDL